MEVYSKWFSRLIWLVTGVNLLFVAALAFFPDWLLSNLEIPMPVPTIWVRIAGLLLFEVTLLGIPCAFDFHRYRATAISVVLARSAGAAFFLGAVLRFGAPTGFLTMALVDLMFALAQGTLLALTWSTASPTTLDPVQ